MTPLRFSHRVYSHTVSWHGAISGTCVWVDRWALCPRGPMHASTVLVSGWCFGDARRLSAELRPISATGVARLASRLATDLRVVRSGKDSAREWLRPTSDPQKLKQIHCMLRHPSTNEYPND